MNNAIPYLTPRRPCRSVTVGNITIGPDHPIVVQSMTNVPTRDLPACLDQINALHQRGCELVRVAVAVPADTAVLPELIARSPVPLIADVHFHYRRALEAVTAGIPKIRLNPGNLTDRTQLRDIIAACRDNNTVVRIGVNEGSVLERRDSAKRLHEQQLNLVELMVAKLREYVDFFTSHRLDNLVLSAKCHDPARTIAVNRLIARQFDQPIHLGVTHAGDVQTGSIRSSLALGSLLAEGIGDTIRVSLAGSPLHEVDTAWEILSSLHLRPRRRPELIACPTCGRTEIDLLDMVRQVRHALDNIHQPITVAVMGCVVNGPGEAENADIALCGGRDKAAIYRHGKLVATAPADRAVAVLLEEIHKLL